jgi:cysteinyl-tRNA synthetase
MTLQIFNVLGREKQPFEPLEEGRVGMYVCGPTVYDHPHLGHAKTYVNFDMVTRWLRYSGYKVLYVQNITDVGHLTDDADMGDDKILKRAKERQSVPMALVETYARSYFEDMDRLNVQRPDISPRASGHVPEQIKMTEALLEKGYAYAVNGSVYFDVLKAADSYGKLSNRRLDQQEAGKRDTIRGEKRNPEDFALWKRAEENHILRWDSPWGEGFPGWHIECSAMAKKYLGATFDIHGGGIDNIYPHNENEIIQSECANDADFAKYWMLVGSLTIDGAKMSKSLFNFITVKDALKHNRPEVLRMFALSAHYSNPVDYSEQAMDDVRTGWERLYGAVQLVRQRMQSAEENDAGNSFLERLQTIRHDFKEVMDDDFGAPRAVAILQGLRRDVNQLLLEHSEPDSIGLNVLGAINQVFNDLGGEVLGIIPTLDESSSSEGDAEREDALIQMLIEMRARARTEKNYAESDRIRDELARIGIVLEDRPDGTIWKLG